MTVAGAYAKIEAHEDICAVRYEGIQNAITDLKIGLKWVVGGMWATAIGVAIWSLSQLYHVQVERPPSPPVAQVQVQAH